MRFYGDFTLLAVMELSDFVKNKLTVKDKNSNFDLTETQWNKNPTKQFQSNIIHLQIVTKFAGNNKFKKIIDKSKKRKKKLFRPPDWEYCKMRLNFVNWI